MIDLHYWTTPNGQKIVIFLEEAGLAYRIHPVNIGRGEQFEPDFLHISPNNRIPAIVDSAPADGGAPLSVFESGAILLYLAAKTGKFLPAGMRARTAVTEWLMWQMGGLGPMLGQAHHFRAYTEQSVPYAVDRYTKEATRLYNVLNRRLEDRAHVCGDYSIADMAIYPWTVSFERQGQSMENFPNVARWRRLTADRPAVAKAYVLAEEMRAQQTPLENDGQAKKILFGQTDTKAPQV